MSEYRIVTFTQPTSAFFHPEAGAVKIQTISFAGSLPQLAEYMDGWTVVNSQLVPAGELTYLSFTLKLDPVVPDSPVGAVGE